MNEISLLLKFSEDDFATFFGLVYGYCTNMQQSENENIKITNRMMVNLLEQLMPKMKDVCGEAEYNEFEPVVKQVLAEIRQHIGKFELVKKHDNEEN